MVKYEIKKDCTILTFKNKKGLILSCTIDSEDLDKITSYKYSWHLRWKNNTKSYYVVASEYKGVSENGNGKYKNVYMQRFLLHAPDDMVVDHINGDTLDNRKSNLRLVSNANNLKNRGGKNSNNTSGYRNVTWDKRNIKWVVQLQVDGKNKQLGRFDDVDEAGEFAAKMREKYYGDYCTRSK